MKKLLSALAVIALVFMFNQDASAQSKVAKKAAKKAAKIMCGCTALKELSQVMKDLEADPSKITPEVQSKMESNIAKAQGCVDELTVLSDKVDEADKTAFGQQTEVIMKKKCPDMVKLLNEAGD
jgi:hypothetical protein